MTNTTSTTEVTEATATTTSRRRSRVVLGLVAGVIVAGGLLVAWPSGADDAPPPGPVAEAPAPSGIYALTREQWAYFVGYEAGRGAAIDSIDPTFVLSDSVMAYLRTNPLVP